MRRLSPAVWLTLAGIAVATALLDWWMPLTGDDLAFQTFLEADDPRGSVRHAIAFIIASLLDCTGRFFDFAGPIAVWALPQWLTSAITGVMGALYFYAVILAAREQRSRPAAALLTILVTLLITPWWDSMWLRTCQYNYVWGTAFALLFSVLFFRRRRSDDRPAAIAGLILLGFLAGATHEQTGVALSASLLIFGVQGGNWRRWTRGQWCIAGALAFGTLITIAAPAIWRRAATESYHFPLGYLVITTLPLYTLVVAGLAVSLCFRRGRQRLRAILGRDGAFLLVASAIAALIALVSGIPGRTGLFAEACAVVIVSRIAVAHFKPMRPIPSAVVCVACMGLIAIHYSAAIRGQRMALREHLVLEELYAESPDGIVYMDYTGRYDFPPAALLRIKGVPDDDDLWSRRKLMLYWRTDNRPLRILPTGLRGRMLLTGERDSVSMADVTVYNYAPATQAVIPDTLPVQLRESASPRVVTAAVTAAGERIWFAVPLVVDPGDIPPQREM
ncbi:MAG: DUF6056 family protein [Candidatus Amulumruptor caecigallinarius]|nr:DUF6056 family protein [Candidatus Amulumruptor caecigallinarius]MCM1395989.1 DUF6056 family protein [Candidatus Amulumruptor caecigallinarius]MCM1454575.1 DUF6056 family protein [bacterium]